MGQVRTRFPDALLMFAYFSGSQALLDRTRQTLIDRFGPIAVQGPRFEFTDTRYYEASMGPGLWKELVALDRTILQSDLPEIKRTTNALEEELGHESGLDVLRPVNIDPGMIDEGKLLLASTKNHAHRVYVRDGIFVEVTLYLCEGEWAGWPWTYPDYRRPVVHAFCTQARQHFRETYKSA